MVMSINVVQKSDNGETALNKQYLIDLDSVLAKHIAEF